MRRWVFVVVALYAVTLVLLILLSVLILHGKVEPLDRESWPLGAAILFFMLLEAGLLATPASAAKHRPVRRRAVVSTYLAAGLASALLFIGAAFCVAAAIWGDDISDGVTTAVLGAGACLWVGWGIFFHHVSRRQSAESALARQCRLLLRGSILELLIAIPSHVIVRRRDTCCAEGITVLGIAVGTAIMLFTFGPSVYFLFANRRDRTRPKPGSVRTVPAGRAEERIEL